jgi:hypothetical protein
MKMPVMPESDKVIAAAPESQKLGEFLEWLEERGYQLGYYMPILDPETRYLVVKCPSCDDQDCWRILDELSLTVSGLMPTHFGREERAHDQAASLEDERLRKAQENPQFVPLIRRKEELLAEYFEIDLDRVEEERRGLLEALRGAQS